MNSVPKILLNDVAALQENNLQLQQLIAEKDQRLARQEKLLEQQRAQIADLFEQFRLNRHRQFGPSSEQGSGQVGLFNEAEQLAAEEAMVLAQSAATETRKPTGRGKRQPLPPHLPRIDVVHELPEHARQCACGCQLSVIGEEISEQLDIIPAKIQVIRNIRKKYVCTHCETAPVTAALPPQPIPKSNASPGLLAFISTAKFADGMPLYRQESILKRAGFKVTRQTQARWMIQSAQWLQAVHNLLRDEMLSGPLIHCDETTTQVLKEPNKPPTSQSRMWVTVGGTLGKNVVLFDYHASRSSAVPLTLLAGYRGYLMTDGYAGYNALAAQDGIDHLSCWQHVRHYFKDAQNAQPKTKGPTTVGKADVALNFIGKLYGIETRIRDATNDTRYQVRQQDSVAVLQQLRAWLDKTLAGVVPSGKLGIALQYLHKYWPKLIRYTENGELPMDNNRAENAIRPFVVGRKAWLFSDTPAGADASAMIYSIIETAKANALEPYAYLRYLFKYLPAATSVDDVEKLLPWNIDRAALISELVA